MKKTILLLPTVVFLFLSIFNPANAQTGSLQGKVTDAKTKEGIPFVTVELLQNGIVITGTVANLNGNYAIKPILPGKYGLYAIAPEYDTVKLIGIEVNADVLSFQDVRMPIASSYPAKKTISEGYRQTDPVNPIEPDYPDYISAVHSSAPVYYYLDGMLIHGRINITLCNIVDMSITGNSLPARYENDLNNRAQFILDIPERLY